MKKGLIISLLVISSLMIGKSVVSAQELSKINNNTYSVSNPNSLYAVRNNFDFTVKYNTTGTKIAFPESGKFKYIRVRLEPGSGYGGKVDFSAIYTSQTGGTAYKLATLSNMYYKDNVNIIIDFKAKNAPCRSDATYCVNCNVISGVSNNDYCFISENSNRMYGIAVKNLTSGTTPRVYGGFSLEN